MYRTEHDRKSLSIIVARKALRTKKSKWLESYKQVRSVSLSLQGNSGEADLTRLGEAAFSGASRKLTVTFRLHR
jgi:hypothetical protein